MANCDACGEPRAEDELKLLRNRDAQWVSVCEPCLAKGVNPEDVNPRLAEEEGDNGYLVWESYVAGLKPTDKNSKLFAYIRFGAGGGVAIDWEPDHRTNRVYTLLGKPELDAPGWTEFPTNAIPSNMQFFKVKVKLQ